MVTARPEVRVRPRPAHYPARPSRPRRATRAVLVVAALLAGCAPGADDGAPAIGLVVTTDALAPGVAAACAVRLTHGAPAAHGLRLDGSLARLAVGLAPVAHAPGCPPSAGLRVTVAAPALHRLARRVGEARREVAPLVRTVGAVGRQLAARTARRCPARPCAAPPCPTLLGGAAPSARPALGPGPAASL